MRKLAAILLLSLAAVTARSDNPPSAPPAATAAPAAIVYEIRELTPAGITQYASASDSVLRQYLEFKNGQGTHNIIYEEVTAAPPLRNVAALRELARAWNSTCAIDIECSSKAFCTGECRNMYYETSNAPGDNLSPDRAKCRVTYFSCEPKVPSSAPAPSVQAASVPAPPATN